MQATTLIDGPQTHTCSQCGGRGHNVLSCPELDPGGAARRRARLSWVLRKVRAMISPYNKSGGGVEGGVRRGGSGR